MLSNFEEPFTKAVVENNNCGWLKIEQLPTCLSGECIYFIFVEKFYVPKAAFNVLIYLKCPLSQEVFALG